MSLPTRSDASLGLSGAPRSHAGPYRATLGVKTPQRRLRALTVEGYGLTPCVYCGMTAETRDHFVPRSWRRSFPNWREGAWRNVPDTLPCCGQCNSIAGAHPFETIAGKRRYVQDRLREKYARLLASPFHSEEDLAALGPTLRSHVEKRETERIRLLMRLAWPYDLGDTVGALTQGLMRLHGVGDVLNHVRREEILR